MAEIENLKIGANGTIHIVGNENIITEEWEASKTYVKDKSYVIREHKLYVCNVTHTSTSSFDPTKWTEITVIGAIDNALDMTAEASGAIATFESEYALPLRDCTIDINAVQESGTPTPSSPKLISGFTGANIGYCDFNQLRRDDTTTNTSEGITTKYDGTTHLVSITNNSRTSYYSSGSTQITLSTTAPIENHVYAYLANTDEQGISVSQTNGNALKQTDVLNTVFKGVSGATGFRLRVTNLYDFVSAHPINNTFSFYLNIIDLTQAFGEYLAEYLYSLTDHGVSIVKQIFTKDYYAYEAGGTKISIESINGSSYPNAHITWQDEAGTVYGGSLDVTSGVLTVTNALYTFVGANSENWANSGSYFYRLTPTDCKIPFTIVSNNYLGVAPTNYQNLNNFEMALSSDANNAYINIYDNRFSVLSDFIDYISNNNLQVLLKLKTPVTYQLTPTQISAIVGTNNVFTDTNGDTSLEYYTKRGEQTVRIAEGVAVDVINNKSIDTLATTDKTVKGAINELEAKKANGWAFVNEVLGNTDINLPTGWSEILAVCRYGNGGVLQPQAVSIVITPEQKGLYMTAGASTILAQVVVSADATKVNMTYFGVSGTEYTSDSQIRVWYR